MNEGGAAAIALIRKLLVVVCWEKAIAVVKVNPSFTI